MREGVRRQTATCWLLLASMHAPVSALLHWISAASEKSHKRSRGSLNSRWLLWAAAREKVIAGPVGSRRTNDYAAFSAEETALDERADVLFNFIPLTRSTSANVVLTSLMFMLRSFQSTLPRTTLSLSTTLYAVHILRKKGSEAWNWA